MVLIEQLRVLEEHGLVWREIFPDEPQRVDYRLTPFGMSLKPLLSLLEEWDSTTQRASGETPSLRGSRAQFSREVIAVLMQVYFLRVLASETEKWRTSHGFTGVRRWDLRQMIVYGK